MGGEGAGGCEMNSEILAAGESKEILNALQATQNLSYTKAFSISPFLTPS